MKTSHIIIILSVLTFIALVTYFVFLNKKNGDSPVPSPSSFVPSSSSFVPSPSSFVPSSQKESLLETVLKQNSTAADTSITKSSFYKLSSTSPESPSPSPIIVPSPTPSVFIEKSYTPHEIISLANDSNTTIEYKDERNELNFFKKYDGIFQDTINALFELSGCEKGSGIPLSRLLGLFVTTKLSNGQQFSTPIVHLLINTALKSQIIDNKQNDVGVTDFITSLLFIDSKVAESIIYNERTKQVTFKEESKPENLTKNTVSLDEFRDFLKERWNGVYSYFILMIKTHEYLDNYPVCRALTL